MRKLYLTIKYWLQGDDWRSAKLYATVICDRWVK